MSTIPTTSTAAVTIRDTAADAPIGTGNASPIGAMIEVLDHPAARGRVASELADVFDAPGLASYRRFNRDISAAHLSAAIGETCSPLSAAVIELGVRPRPSRYRRDVDCGCRGLSPRCRHWRSYFLCGGSSRGDRLRGHEWRNACAPQGLHAFYWNRRSGV